MTSVTIPDFVTALFSKEGHRLVESILQKVSEDYGLDADELKDRYLGNSIEVIDGKLQSVTIKTKRKFNGDLPLKYRCCARTWNDGNGGRCKWRKTADSDFCANHLKKHKENKLKHGTIHDPRPKDVFVASKTREKLY
jgi:hypothetical protein